MLGDADISLIESKQDNNNDMTQLSDLDFNEI